MAPQEERVLGASEVDVGAEGARVSMGPNVSTHRRQRMPGGPEISGHSENVFAARSVAFVQKEWGPSVAVGL